VRKCAAKKVVAAKPKQAAPAPKVRGIIFVGETKNALIDVGGQSSVAGAGDTVAGYKILCLSSETL